MTETTEEYRPFAAQLSNVYLTILALFCFKLFVRITLNLLTHFYIIKGNRREAARISADFYANGQGYGKYTSRSVGLIFFINFGLFEWIYFDAYATILLMVSRHSVI